MAVSLCEVVKVVRLLVIKQGWGTRQNERIFVRIDTFHVVSKISYQSIIRTISMRATGNIDVIKAIPNCLMRLYALFPKISH